MNKNAVYIVKKGYAQEKEKKKKKKKFFKNKKLWSFIRALVINISLIFYSIGSITFGKNIKL